MGECFEHAQAEHLSFAQAQAERLLIRNGRVLLIIAQAEHLSFAQAQAEHLQTRNGRVLFETRNGRVLKLCSGSGGAFAE